MISLFVNRYIRIILAPLVGGLIGYITNYLAIKMLFRPRKSIYIGKWHVPFTPGLIPQQKSRIAQSIGKVVSTQLLNSDTVKETILSENNLSIIKEKLIRTIDGYQYDTRTVQEIVLNYAELSELEDYKIELQDKGTELLIEKMKQNEISRKIVQAGVNAIKEKLKLNMFGNILDENFFGYFENIFTKIVDETIVDKAPEIIRNEIKNVEDDILKTPICKLYDSQEQNIPAIIDRVINIYQSAIENNLDKILRVIDVENIVVEKVNSFDAIQLEQMIFGIMKKELNAIVYLGALLGFLMGFINLLW